MKTEKTFPPGAGWLPLTIALIIALLLSAIAFTPQFFPRVLVGQGNAANPKAITGSADPNATNNPSGGAADTIVGPGAGTSAIGPGSTVQGGTSAGSHAACSKSGNGGATAPGVTADEIHVASTIVTDGVGKSFLGEAQDGIQAAINEANNKGGICGRRVTFTGINSSWNGQQGKSDIQSFIQEGKTFALVAQPDSEGLRQAIDTNVIDGAAIPVVGTDGLLKGQYADPWVYPVAASSVSNMHIIAKYAHDHGATEFGIVYDQQYKFGQEGATAFAAEVQRLGGHINAGGNCATGYCPIDSSSNNYSSQYTQFSGYCKNKCQAVVMLVEPGAMETWMAAAGSDRSWFKTLFGGEPLFDDNVANQCDGCGQAPMFVWTGYQPAISPFDARGPVAQYKSSLLAVKGSDDPHNEFTEGAYIGTKLFLAACQKVGDLGLPLTRANLKSALDHNQFDFGLSQPIDYHGGALPHISNSSMAEFKENYSGHFNGWSYQGTDFIADPARGQDLQ